MIMSGYEFMGRAPYHTVYLHGPLATQQHRKMSKSLGNGIDPIDVVKLYGADALRWTLIAGSGMGADVILDPSDIDKSFATGTQLRNEAVEHRALFARPRGRRQRRADRRARCVGSSRAPTNGFSRGWTPRSPNVIGRWDRCGRRRRTTHPINACGANQSATRDCD
jgi:hypothetical protein